MTFVGDYGAKYGAKAGKYLGAALGAVACEGAGGGTCAAAAAAAGERLGAKYGEKAAHYAEEKGYKKAAEAYCKRIGEEGDEKCIKKNTERAKEGLSMLNTHAYNHSKASNCPFLAANLNAPS